MARRAPGAGKFIKRHRKDADGPYMVGAVTIGVFSVVSVVLFGASWMQSMLLSSNNFAAVITSVLVDLANSDRDTAGVSALAVNKELTAAAQAKADDMAARGYFAHTSPDGRQPWDFINAAGYSYQYAGENLAIQFSDSAAVEAAWLASPKHRENILDGHYTEVGIATAQGFYQGHETTFVVQMFGSPRALAVAHPSASPKPAVTLAEAATAGKTVLGASTQAAEVAAPATAEAPRPQAGFLAHVAASPKTYFDDTITFLAALTLVIGGYLWWQEMRQRHLRHSAYIILLALGLIAFLYVADALIFTDPVIAGTFATMAT